MEPLISVIIPIYNTEPYLVRCLDSVLYAEDLNIEVICVNDGSRDHSLQICKDYQAKDQRIRILDQENSGVSIARNNGLKLARGKWVMFVDSDDVLLKPYYSMIISVTEPYDLIMFDAIWGDKEIEGRESEKEWTKRNASELIPNILRSESISAKAHTSLRSACIKAYRLEFIREINDSFPERIKIGEDMLFNIPVFAKAERVKYYPVDIYQEIDRNGSATHSFVPDMIQNDIMFQWELKKRLDETETFSSCSSAYYSEVKSGILRCLRKKVFHKQGNYTNKEKKELLRRMLDEPIYHESLQYKDNNRKRNLILWLYQNQMVTALSFIFKHMDS